MSKKKRNLAILLIGVLCIMLLGNLVSANMVKAAEPTKLKMVFIAMTGTVPSDLKLVEEEINKIAIEKINARVELIPLTMGNYEQQMNLMFSSGETFDICMVFLEHNFNSFAKNGYLMDLGELLDEYGQGIKEVVDPVYLNGTKVDGELYGLTTLRDLASGVGVVMRKDMVEKYNIDIDAIETLEDLGDVLAKVKEERPDMTPLVPSQIGASVLDIYNNTDRLGNVFGVLLNQGQELKVVNWFETEEYKQQLKLLREWYNKGYILEDYVINTIPHYELIRNDQGFCYISPTKPGLDIQETNMTGVEMVVKELIPPFSTTRNIQLMSWAIPYTSQHSEKAMEFLNLMYTDADIVNLFAWGIEGRHYEFKDNGLIGYPAGVTASNSGYNLQTGWMFGNQFLSHVWVGNEPDLWKQTSEFNNRAFKSNAIGFVFDQAPVHNEIAALSNVASQYRMALETGSVDPDTVLPVFLQKLKANGIDKVVSEKQRQLDEWVAQNQ